MGKIIKVTNGTDTFDVASDKLQLALNDGYKPVEKITVHSTKTGETFEVNPENVSAAYKDGYTFSDIIKKKDKSSWADGGLRSESGGKAGTSGVLSGFAKRIVKNPTESVEMSMVKSSKATPQEQAKLDYGKKMVGEGEIEVDENDPLKSFLNPIENKLAEKRNRAVSSSTSTATSIASNNISTTQLLNEKRDLGNQRFGTQQEAEMFVAPKLDKSKLVMKEGVDMSSGHRGLDMFTDESIAEATPKDNLTANVATKQYLNTRKLKENLATSGSLEEAAIKNAMDRGDLASKQMGALGGDIPRAMKGNIVLDFINDPSVRELAQGNQELTNKIRQEAFDLPRKYPEAAIRILSALISDERESRGENNAILNLPGAKVSDEIVDELVARGDLPLQYKQFYENPAVRFAVNSNLKTSGLIENTLRSADESVYSMGKSVADLTQVRKLYSSKEDRLYNTLSKDYQNYAFKPKGLLHKVSTSGGIVTGQVLPMMLGGTAMRAMNLVKNPTVGNSIMAGMQTWGENRDRALAELPDASEAKQLGYAAINTGIEIALANVLNETKLAKDLLKGAAPRVKSVINKFTNKEITSAAAKSEIENIFSTLAKFGKGTAKTSVKEANEEFSTQVLQTANNQVFGGEPQSFAQQANDAFDVWTTTLMGSGLLGMGGGIVEVNKNPSAPKLVYEMASNPEKYISIMREQAETDPEYAKDIDQKLDNLQHIVDVKKELDGRDMKEGAKEKYLLKSLSEKILNEKAATIPDKGLKADTEKQLATLEIEKDNLLNPDKSNTKVVQDYYDNELLPKGLMEMLEVEGKFNEAKTGEFLKLIFQQDHNLDEDFKPIKGEFKMKAPAGVPQEIIDIANERWKDKIPSPATLDFDYESGEPVVSGGGNVAEGSTAQTSTEQKELKSGDVVAYEFGNEKMSGEFVKWMTDGNGVERAVIKNSDGTNTYVAKKDIQSQPKEESVSVPEENSVNVTFENKSEIEDELKEKYKGDDIVFHGSPDISFLNKIEDINTADNTVNAESKYFNVNKNPSIAVTYSQKQNKFNPTSGVGVFKISGKKYEMKKSDILNLKSNEAYEDFYDKKKAEGYDYISVPQDGNNIVVLNNNALKLVAKENNLKPQKTTVDETTPVTKKPVNLQDDGKEAQNIGTKEGQSTPSSTQLPSKESTEALGKRYKRVVNDNDFIEPYDRAVKYFADGGGINPSELERIFGGKGDKGARISLMKNNAGTVKQIAHYLWETDTSGKHEDTDYIDAIEEALRNSPSKSAMQKDLVDRYDWEAAQQKYQEQQYGNEAIAIVEKLSDEDIDYLLQLAADENNQTELETYIDELLANETANQQQPNKEDKQSNKPTEEAKPTDETTDKNSQPPIPPTEEGQ